VTCDRVYHTAPWLIRSDVDLPERTKTRSHMLKVNETIKTIVVCAGQAEELPLFAEIALKLHQEFPKCAILYFSC